MTNPSLSLLASLADVRWARHERGGETRDEPKERLRSRLLANQRAKEKCIYQLNCIVIKKLHFHLVKLKSESILTYEERGKLIVREKFVYKTISCSGKS